MDTIQGFIEKVETKQGVKKDGTNWTQYKYTIEGQVFSGFKDLELKEGDKVQMTYEANGKYLNYKSIVMMEPRDAKVTTETLQEKKPVVDNRQDAIALGQAANMALKHMHEAAQSMADEVFDVKFKETTKRFYQLLKELREELL